MRHGKRILFPVLAIVAMAAGCAQLNEPVGGGQEQLKANHWTPLFNGKDLTGWEPIGGAVWKVENGELVGVQGPNYAPGDLLTKDNYSDFELLVTYRVEWPANTGVWFRYQAPQKAYQADILKYAQPVAYSGSLYCPGKMFLAINSNESLENRNGWNLMKIQAKGDHLQIWLNDHKTADVHEKLTDTGKIGFQVHPGKQFGTMKVAIREVKIRLPQ